MVGVGGNLTEKNPSVISIPSWHRTFWGLAGVFLMGSFDEFYFFSLHHIQQHFFKDSK